MKKKIAIIKEGKLPADKRVPLSPNQCVKLMQIFPEIEITVEPNYDRCFSNDEYISVGINVNDDIKDCDIFLGIKEIPVEQLIKEKIYLFFSHTIKKQPHNRALLREIIRKKITLIDYETLTWDNGSRIVGFGRYAGIVGAHNGLLTYGKKYNLYNLKPAYKCKNYSELLDQYSAIKIPNIKICVTGDGRVSHGVLELFNKLKIREVTPRAYEFEKFDEAVFVHLRSEHYYEHKEHYPWDKSDFYHNPEDYISVFNQYTKVTDVMINGIFWHAGVPMFFTKEDMKADDFKVKVIADISCDIPGSIPSTLKATSIDKPVYGYHRYSENIVEPFQQHTVDMMTVGNLPCELPLDASLGFGEELIRSVLPHLFSDTKDEIIERATIVLNGGLTEKYSYLNDYIS